MRVHEYKKIGKICDEIITYLLRKHYTNVKTYVKIEDNIVTLLIEVENIKDNDLSYMISSLSKKRDDSLEEFGWELLGESEESNELELVGMLLNKFYCTTTDNVTTLELIRYVNINQKK